MRKLAPLAFAVLAACGGGGGGLPIDSILPALGDAVPPPVGDGFFPNDRPWMIATPSGRFGVMNANLPTITDVEVLDSNLNTVTGWNGLAIQQGQLWEVEESDDLEPGFYWVRGYCALGTVIVSLVRSTQRDGVILDLAHREFDF